MTPFELYYDELEPLFTQASRSAHRRNPLVDPEDLYQVAAMWCVEHPRKLDEYMTDEDKRRGTKMVITSMTNACKDFARKDRAARCGYHLDDSVYYALKVLKDDLLPAVYDDEMWLSPPTGDVVRNDRGDPALGGNWLATLADVSTAIQLLSKQDQHWLHLKYKLGWTLERIADECDFSVSTADRRVSAAVRRIQDKLGGSKPYHDPAEEGWEEYVATREVLSNSEAIAITDALYD